MKKLYHRGAPCVPPVVNGVHFAQSEEHEHLFVGEVPDDALASFEGVHSFHEDPAHFDEPTSAPMPITPDGPNLGDQLDALNTSIAQKDATIAAMQVKLDTAAAEIEALKAQLEELEAIDADLDDEGAEGSDDLVAKVKADIEALEAKKAEGKTSRAENMKLGKLQKKLQELTAAK